jgi:hypothetical protein
LQGRAPLLVQHSQHVEDVIGVIEQGWIEDLLGLAVVRFARTERADRFWRMLVDGIPISASLGYAVLEAEPAPDHTEACPHFICRRWRADEISLVGFGRDYGARVDTSLSGLVELLQTKREEREIERRVERGLALRSDRWRAWARDGACDTLASRLGIASDLLRPELSRLVDEHLQEFVRE